MILCTLNCTEPTIVNECGNVLRRWRWRWRRRRRLLFLFILSTATNKRIVCTMNAHANRMTFLTFNCDCMVLINDFISSALLSAVDEPIPTRIQFLRFVLIMCLRFSLEIHFSLQLSLSFSAIYYVFAVAVRAVFRCIGVLMCWCVCGSAFTPPVYGYIVVHHPFVSIDLHTL